MDASEPDRRSFLFTVGGLGINQMLSQAALQSQTATQQGYVLGPNEGEHLIHFRDHGNIFIKLGSATGSESLAIGTQQVMAGTGIPVHRHFKMDEAFYVLEGSGTFILNDARHSFEQGGTIFIPKNSWHGFENPDHELVLLWLVTPAGLDGFFREICSPPGARESSSPVNRSMRSRANMTLSSDNLVRHLVFARRGFGKRASSQRENQTLTRLRSALRRERI
jgi:quercetin dioxygenase-like cupin family protein